MNPQHKQKAFTLIEILVALMIFSILSLISSMAMKKFFTQYDALKKNYREWKMLNQVIQDFSTHTEHLIMRGVKANGEHLFPVFIGQNSYVEWTTLEQRPQRIAYVCHDGKLSIRQWGVLDPLDRNHFHEKILLSGLEDCRFRYLFPNHDIQGMWVPSRSRSTPKGIQLMLSFQHQQTLDLWFALPPYTYEIQTQ
jgi:general secretion pathway protein J